MRGNGSASGRRDERHRARRGRKCEALLAPESPPAAFVMGGMDLLRPLGLAGVPLVVVARPARLRASRDSPAAC